MTEIQTRNELLTFDPSEYEARLGRVRERMRAEGMDVALITSQDDNTYLTGYPHGYPPQQAVRNCLVLPLEGELTLVERLIEEGNVRLVLGRTIDRACYYGDGPEMAMPGRPALYKMIADVLAAQRLETKRIGVQMGTSSLPAQSLAGLRQAVPGAVFADATDLVEACRLIKSPVEVDCARRAARVASKACAAGIAAVREGVSENDVAAAIFGSLLGCPDYEFTRMWPHIASGDRAAMAHATWAGRILREGDTVYLEVPASINRYHAVVLRTVVVGPPNERQREVAGIIREALEAAIGAIRPGARAGDVDRACRSVVDTAGYGSYFRHRTGYTIGLEWSQQHGINLVPGGSAELRPGMIFHVIPICMFFGEGAIGMSESVLVTEHGAEVLTDLERKLFVAC